MRSAVKFVLCALLVACVPFARADSDEEEGFRRLLSAHLLAEAGQLGAAAVELVGLGIERGDAQILRDATEYALRANLLPVVLRASREWIEIEDSKEANQIAATALLRMGEMHNAKAQLAKLVAKFGFPPQEYREIAAHAQVSEHLVQVTDLMDQLYPPAVRGGEYYHNLSLLRERAGDSDEALAAAAAAADMSGDVGHEFRYARMLVDSDYDAALERLRRIAAARAAEPGAIYAVLAQVQLSARAKESLEMMSQAYSDSNATAEELYYLARMALFANEHESGRRYARAAIDRSPTFDEARFLLAFMQTRNGESTIALNALERLAAARSEPVEAVVMSYSYYETELTAQAAAPNNNIPRFALSNYRAAVVFEELGDLERAERTFLKVRESDGYIYFYAQSVLARLLMKRGDKKSAYATVSRLRRHYELAERRYVGNRDMVTEGVLSEAELVKLDRGVAAALEFLERELPGLDDVRPVLYQIAIYAEELDDLERAERALREYIKAKQSDTAGLDDPDGYNALGYLLADKNLKLDEAHELIELALRSRPDDPNIIDSLGWVQYRQGKLGLARANLILAAKRSMAAEIHAHLGEVFWMIGDRESANVIWSRALYLHPDNEILVETIERLKTL